MSRDYRAARNRYSGNARPRKCAEPVLPLINIVFLLLIFFMLAGRFTFHDPFRIVPPRSGIQGTAAGHDLLVVVAADGRLGLNGDVLEPAALKSELSRRLARGGEANVHVMADSRAEARHVVTVMELLQESGAAKLRLLTLPGNH